jgi:polyphosphate kinase
MRLRAEVSARMKGKNRFDSTMFFDRDLSWLSFNERVLLEARSERVPLMERIRFLSIYSSNLDEFYRVRMPTLLALNRLNESDATVELVDKVNSLIINQLGIYGSIVRKQIVPELHRHNVFLMYDEDFSDFLVPALKRYFVTTVAGYIEVTRFSKNPGFFPENNKLYLAVRHEASHQEEVSVVNIPSDSLPRFHETTINGKRYVVFIDDIVKLCLPLLFSGKVISSFSFKITRNAELDLEDEFKGNLARKIEKKIQQRDYGLATRFLYSPGFHPDTLELLKSQFNLNSACFVEGGRYHNLKDFSSFPLNNSEFQYEPLKRIEVVVHQDSLFDEIRNGEKLLHPPYHSYDDVLRFFNQAAIDPDVKTIYVTLYRVARESRIVNALITAARNGKRVVVFVELKARFDEANNLRWSKKMKAAGVRIIESIPGLKVHAKLALIKRKVATKTELFGLLSTGNFNEITARFYTDHILLTADEKILIEAEMLFKILKKRKARLSHSARAGFQYLLVGQFNLQERFIELIDREISFAKSGLRASIKIKFNNLEEKVLIEKLYEASRAGVNITLIVRGICCLIPGVKGMSENIKVLRIVDRFLEHGRVFIFGNNGSPEVYLGSADWMNRNIYRRIEVCFPVNNDKLRAELIDIFNTYANDNVQAVTLDEGCRNVPVQQEGVKAVRAQVAVGETLVANSRQQTADS